MATSKPCWHAPEIKQPKRRQALIEHAEQARLSKELVQLDDHVPLPCPIDDLAVKPIDPRQASPRSSKEQDFRSLLARLSSRLKVPAQPKRRAARVGACGSGRCRSGSRGRSLADAVAALRADPGSGDARSVDRCGARAGHRRDRHRNHARSTSRPELVGIALALGAGPRRYIPLGHRIAKVR